MNLLDQLTISDPLEKQEVNIIITLPASEKAKDERPALISVGMAHQMPVIKTGVLGSVDDLLHQAWKEFGVQTEAAKAQAGAQPVEEDDDLGGISSPSGTYAGIELDIRGRRVEDGLVEMDRFLDNAFLSRMPWVRIIHGKGTGKLRTAVREALKSNSHVKSFDEGIEGEGGAGVTVAKLVEHK